MWRDNLLAIIKESGLTKHQIAERGNLPYETVKRVAAGLTENPYLDTLDRFAMALGCSLADILLGTGVVIGNKKLIELQESIDTLTSQNDILIAERDSVIAENIALKTEVTALTNEILRIQLTHKDEIIELYKLLYQSKINKEV